MRDPIGSERAAASEALSLEIEKANYFATAARENWISFVSFALFLIFWELICRFEIVGPYQLVPPSEVVTLFIDKFSNANPDGALLYQHAAASLGLALAGFLAAVVIGVPLGLFMGWYPAVNMTARPLFDAIRPIPPIAWIPIAILWLGVAEGSKIFICFVGAFVIMILNAYTGMRYVDPLLIDATKSFGANRTQQFFNVAVPACMPSIFAGVQNALSMAWMCVLAAEMVGARQGVGFIIIQGMDLNKPAMILVGMVLIGIIGSLLAVTLRQAEKLLCPWRRELV